MSGWRVILEGDGGRAPAQLECVPSDFLAVPNLGDIIEGNDGRYVVTCVAHGEEARELPPHIQRQLAVLAGEEPPPSTERSDKVRVSAVAAVARTQLERRPQPVCKIYVVKAPTP